MISNTDVSASTINHNLPSPPCHRNFLSSISSSSSSQASSSSSSSSWFSPTLNHLCRWDSPSDTTKQASFSFKLSFIIIIVIIMIILIIIIIIVIEIIIEIIIVIIFNIIRWDSPSDTTKRGSLPSAVEYVILAWVAGHHADDDDDDHHHHYKITTGLIWSEIKQLWDMGLKEYVSDIFRTFNILPLVSIDFYRFRLVSFIFDGFPWVSVVFNCCCF